MMFHKYITVKDMIAIPQSMKRNIFYAGQILGIYQLINFIVIQKFT